MPGRRLSNMKLHTRDAQYKKDKMATIREVCEMFNEKCGKYTMPGG